MNLSETSQHILENLSPIDHNQLYSYTFKKLEQWHLSEQLAHIVNTAIWVAVLIVVLLVVDFITNKLIINLVVKIIRRTKNNFDDFLIQNKTLVYIGRYIPLSVTKYLIPVVFQGYPPLVGVLVTFVDILMVVTLLMIIRSIFKVIRDIARTKPAFSDKPLDSYLQVFEIFLLFVGGTIIFSIITGNSPWTFLASLGAASAILMLIFKDTILGFVASVQVSANDSIRVGDWIEMPKYGADGDVIEINLNNIKVQNWDKTITTIPTHLLLADSFKNWRGMQASGGRRIKRAIHVKISTIRFLTEEEIEKLHAIAILSDYIEKRREEIKAYNESTRADASMPINGRRMTNVGLFRAYIMAYARQNPRIHQGMTLLVRQLAPAETGLPIELYMFTNDIRWAVFEEIMADIFDHLFAAIKYFHLEVYEAPASDDLRHLQLMVGKLHD
ncbi:mechanosensitive ion channel [Parapedobacter sp. SGR-10]|uniref:mechanosensitive ion channel family protein n=1 Tax=Parapedobacter sp. SGR-10 TaxID=2710879 RepID=UPI0013D2C764|nr:mechanosensitive ion channel domain-containing protein [Parapedobacter sp. SGR-10]NGF58094.1 mechanosensitive ion channel [Parapedobacter sp. SGR-10]